MLKPTLAIILVVSVTAGVLISQKNKELEELAEINAELKRELLHKEREYQREIAELKNQNIALKKEEEATAISTPQVPEIVVTKAPVQEKLSRPEWQAKVSLRRVEEHLALSSEERSRLEERLRSGRNLTVLSEIVGEERASKFFSDEKKAYDAEEEEAIKEKTFRLVRILGLSSEQEARLERIVRSSRENLKVPLQQLKVEQERAMELHSEPNSGEELRAVYEKYRSDLEAINNKDNAYLIKELKSVLTEDQLNKFLEYQATEKQTLR